MASWLEQIWFKFDVSLVSDLHVGTGEREKISELRSDDERLRDEQETQDVLLVARDHDAAPYLPASGLKGALRANLAQRHGPEFADTLFGSAKRTEQSSGGGGEDVFVETGGMAKAVLYRGVVTGEPPNSAEGLPFWCRERRTYVNTQVALNRTRGTAEDKHLFKVELVPAETRFRVEGCYLGSGADARRDLARLLAPLAATGPGLAIGGGQRQGRGRLRLADGDRVALTRKAYDAKGHGVIKHELEELAIPAGPDNEPAHSWDLALHCPGPYLTGDPGGAVQENNRLAALSKDGGGSPILQGTSFMGALRGRTAWLAEIDEIADGDDPFLKPDRWKTPRDLTRCQRLFGVTGWRGLLELVSLQPAQGAEPRKISLPGIALDRFSGAVLDSALFMTDAFTGVGFDVRLRLHERDGLDKELFDKDLALIQAALGDLESNELLVGHGTNRGFGWFDVSVSSANTQGEAG